MKTEAPTKTVTLKYDGGEVKSFASQSSRWGYSVHFSPPATPFSISKVEVLLDLYGTVPADQVALLEIWDEDFNVLYSREIPATELSTNPRWVAVEANIKVDSDFRVVFFTNWGEQEGGISIGYDISGNKASEVAKADGTYVGWIPQWESGPNAKPEDKINWMIRVEGSHSTIPGSAEEKPTVKEIELKHDSGIFERGLSGGLPGWGYSVHFSPPAIPFTIVGVKVFVKLGGTGYQLDKASVEIWNHDFDVLYSGKGPPIEYTPEAEWVTIDIPNITVDSDFRVVFFPNASGAVPGAIVVFYDLSGNKGSEWAKSGGEILDGPFDNYPEAGYNWMIRVVGTPTEKGTTFQETINSLDSPQKLSQWMIENIKSESYYEREKESGTRYTPTPQETFEARSGNCRVFAVFACYILQYHGYEAEILGIKVESDERMNHVVCVYRSDGSLYVINNGRMEGPYQNYEDIASAHHEGWSSYEIHYSWESYQQLKRPDEIVYR